MSAVVARDTMWGTVPDLEILSNCDGRGGSPIGTVSALYGTLHEPKEVRKERRLPYTCAGHHQRVLSFGEVSCGLYLARLRCEAVSVLECVLQLVVNE